MDHISIRRQIEREKRRSIVALKDLEQNKVEKERLDWNFARLKAKLQRQRQLTKQREFASKKRQKLKSRRAKNENNSDERLTEESEPFWNGRRGFESRSMLSLMLEECFEMSLNVRDGNYSTPPSRNKIQLVEISQSTRQPEPVNLMSKEVDLGDESREEEFMLESEEVDNKTLTNSYDFAGKLNDLFGEEKKVWILRELLAEEKEMRFMLKFLSLVVLCLDETTKSEDHSKAGILLPVMVKLWIFVKNCENM